MKAPDWIKFFPFVHRRTSRQHITEVKGPYFSKRWKNTWNMGDSVFEFYAPWAVPVLGTDGDSLGTYSRKPGKADVLKKTFERSIMVDGPRLSGWKNSYFYANNWYFLAPWFKGVEATLAVKAAVVKSYEPAPGDNLGLFNPKVFELAVGQYIDKRFGRARHDGKPFCRGPMRWESVPICDSVNALLVDIHVIGNTGIEFPDLMRMLYFPVSDNQFVEITFDFGGTDILRDKVRTIPQMELCDSIINSMRLHVGPKTRAAWEKAQRPGVKLSESMGEFNWPIIEEDASNESAERDITPTDVELRLEDRS
ncbi:hypothetical protein A3746_05915 [Oleibacter sp. HI0075]|jgi:hypothetical protein|nr:hypothetical protein A3746_05915 [Oleibacter sp. HI0075]